VRGLTKIVAALAVLAAAPGFAEERITSFVSDVRVEANGTLDVVETIGLVSEGTEIKRGIQRDFPTRYRSGIGRQVVVGFTVVDVARDGHPEPYSLIGMSNGERVRIGSADMLLAPGAHVFRIHYRTTRQIAFYRDFDELYWNATGTGWTFPIERAEARITLPRTVPFGRRAVYTGYQGAQDHDAIVAAEAPGRIVFRTTRRLEASQGLTVAASWAKGVVAEPGAATRFGWALREQGPLLLAIAGLLALLAYIAATLWRVKRNPDRRPMVPLFAPPDDLSAAALRLIWRMGFDGRAFSAAIVDSAVRGGLRIVEAPGGGRKPLRTLEKGEADAALPPAEAKMLTRLFRGKPSVALALDNYERLTDARGILRDELERAHGDGRSFSDAAKQAFAGWRLFAGLMLLIAFALALAGGSTPWPTTLGIAAAAIAIWFALRLLARGRRAMRSGQGGRKMLSWIGSALLWLALVGPCGMLLVLGLTSSNILPLAIPLIAIPFIAITGAQLRAPTAEGWAMRARILGFRHYLSVAEEDRLEKLHPPERTVALFERYLPYAIALGVENRWAMRFTAVLAAAAAGDAAQDQPLGWYSGRRDRWQDPGSFATAIGASLSASIASATTLPSSSSDGSSSSSSSGSSGGGSSGGGGGGGGGSGW
jgi:uncharacterized membrane protein YgcG